MGSEGDTETLSSLLFPRCFHGAGLGPEAWNWRSIQLSSVWVAGMQILSPHHCLPGSALAES